MIRYVQQTPTQQHHPQQRRSFSSQVAAAQYGHGGGLPMAGGSGAAQPQQQYAVANRQANASRKRRRFADKIVLPEVRALVGFVLDNEGSSHTYFIDQVPEVEAYMGLLSFEQKLDATLTRKKLDIQEALKRPMKVKRKLRIFVSHSFITGKEPEREGDEGVVPMWELRVEGRLLDEPSPLAPTATNAPTTRVNVPKRKFSSFFKSLVIELDKDIYGPDNHLVEWHRTPATNETDGFQVSA